MTKEQWMHKDKHNYRARTHALAHAITHAERNTLMTLFLVCHHTVRSVLTTQAFAFDTTVVWSL